MSVQWQEIAKSGVNFQKLKESAAKCQHLETMMKTNIYSYTYVIYLSHLQDNVGNYISMDGQ